MNVTELKRVLNDLGDQFKYAQVRVVERNLIFTLKPENVYLDSSGQVCIDIEQNEHKAERQSAAPFVKNKAD